jgi:hypothetical protein
MRDRRSHRRQFSTAIPHSSAAFLTFHPMRWRTSASLAANVESSGTQPVRAGSTEVVITGSVRVYAQDARVDHISGA